LGEKAAKQEATEAAAARRMKMEELDPLETARTQQAEAEQMALRLVENRIGDCVASTPIPPVPVRFQFLLSADKKTFNISYIDQRVFGGVEAKALDFIFF
jgi:hypothetical protein